MDIALVTRSIPIAVSLLYIFLPGFVLFAYLDLPTTLDSQDLIWALENALIQSVFSAIACLFIGVLGALALLSLSKYKMLSSTLIWLMLLPSFLPPLFTILSALALIDPFPMGNVGVIITHSLSYSGFVSVLLARFALKNLQSQAEVSYLLGASHWLALRKIFFPQLIEPALNLFFIVFAGAFTSFSIPLALGGGKGTNLEVLIFEKIRIEGNWGSAFALASIQSLLLFGLYCNQNKKLSTELAANHFNEHFPFRKWLWLLIFCIPSLSLTTAYVFQLAEAAEWRHQFPLLAEEVLSLCRNTFFVGLWTGLLSLMSLIAIIPLFFYLKERASILQRVFPPSQAFVALAMIFVFSTSQFWQFVMAVSIASLYCSLPFLIKMNYLNSLRFLQNQYYESLRMGASVPSSMVGIILPQLWPTLCFLSGICAVWASGDFAISRIIGLHSWTLAMKIDSLVGSYRIFAATQLSALWIVLAGILFYCFNGVFNVAGQKIIQNLWRLQSPYR